MRGQFGQSSSLVRVTGIVATLWATFLSSRVMWHVVNGESNASVTRLPSHSNIIVRRATLAATDSIESAVDHDPFNASRMRPRGRFRFPGEATLSDSLTPPSTLVARAVRLIGTVVLENDGRNGFVICQLGEEPPRVLRINEQLGDLTLKQIAREKAVFMDSKGGLLVIRTSGSGG